jgi:hypothetical protein
MQAAVASAFLETHLVQHVASLNADQPGLDIDVLRPPQQHFDDAMLGDFATVVNGQDHGWAGVVDWISPDNDGWVCLVARNWFNDEHGHQPSIFVHLNEVAISKPQHTLMYSKDKGYDVTIGDTLQIVRGEYHGMIGIVRRVDFTEATVELISDVDGSAVRDQSILLRVSLYR